MTHPVTTPHRLARFALVALLTLLTLLAACRGSAAPPATPAASAQPPTGAPAAALPLVVDVDWLAAHLGDPELVLLHVGDPQAYAERHVPGARLVTFKDFAVGDGTPPGLILELPSPDVLRRNLQALGISDHSKIVVAFGGEAVSFATRLLFTLDAAGLGARAAWLDGGVAAWEAAGRPTTAALPPPPGPAALAPLTMRSLTVDAPAVLAELGKPGFAVVDARDRVFYEGQEAGGEPEAPHRPGHIRGALSVPYTTVFDERRHLRSDTELRALFTAAGVAATDTVITYCHIGQQATAVILAARRLGHAVLLYDGSFQDWSQRPSYPIVTTPGAAPAPPR